MNAQQRPFDDFRALIKAMPEPDAAAVDAARARQAELTKPAGSLGRLEEIAIWLAGWQGGAPHVDAPLVAVFAGNHGVVARGVSAYPASVTQAMVANFAAGGAAINQICKTFDISLRVFELALERPTGDITPRAGARREGLRGDDGVRHGGARRRTRSALPRRNGHRQHHRGGGDLLRALWRRAGGLGRPRHRRRRRRR